MVTTTKSERILFLGKPKIQIQCTIAGEGGALVAIEVQERKRHINIKTFSGDCPGGGGSPDPVSRDLPTGGQRSKVHVLCAEPKEHKHFRPGTRPGGSGTRPGGSETEVTEKLFMC